jgi:nicotinamidase/pyrazinamidase
MINPAQFIQKNDGLIVVDVQWDFCPGGHLPVPEGHLVVPVLNEWIRVALYMGVPVYASRDWHPQGHISFKERGGLWPPHCIQDKSGAQFHPELIHDDRIVVVTKGNRFDQDQNSAFDETGLQQQLKYDGIRRLFVGGLALDVCVLATVIDAVHNGFDTYLIKDATRPVNEENGRRALEQMVRMGVTIL